MPQSPKGEKRPGPSYSYSSGVSCAAIFGYCVSDVRAMLRSKRRHHVVFAIVTHKDAKGKSKNLPLFSRISLMRNLKALQVRGVKGSFGFIEDKTPKTEGTKKKRRENEE